MGLYPGGDCLVDAALSMWNKVLLVPFHLAVFCSGDGDGRVRWCSTGSGVPGLVGFCVGTFGRLLSAALVLAARREEACGEALGAVAVWYVNLASLSSGLRQDGQIQAWVCMGRVPGRCSSLVCVPFVSGDFCGSLQSLCAVVLSRACGWGLLAAPFSGDSVGGGSRWKAVTPVDTEAPKDFHVFFFFGEGLCQVWLGQLSPVYPLRMRSYLYASMYVFLTW
ncbi:hypothetical protein PVAP13_4NG100200 [Panicum virgatum]|uniref:Uncharacterized protein n=1 Tax=Panicum virgatum TaxID=38727 RepID=A0A8T0T0S0_PANVG|nr:hypothetical protein PVAP13_4NG100200 [Panicum virgatum]